jgi:glycine/D-amino acid oxidase-like deaminating enzyme
MPGGRRLSGTIPVPIPFQKAISYPGQAQFHPTNTVLALAKAFEEAGGVILQNCHVDQCNGRRTAGD